MYTSEPDSELTEKPSNITIVRREMTACLQTVDTVLELETRRSGGEIGIRAHDFRYVYIDCPIDGTLGGARGTLCDLKSTSCRQEHEDTGHSTQGARQRMNQHPDRANLDGLEEEEGK